jgi:hypothetical protein
MSVCWEQELIESGRAGTLDFYDEDSANLSPVEGRAKRGLATCSSLDGALVLDMLGGDVSLFHEVVPAPPISLAVRPTELGEWCGCEERATRRVRRS